MKIYSSYSKKSLGNMIVFQGFIDIVDGTITRKHSKINRLSRKDALLDAKVIRRDYLDI